MGKLSFAGELDEYLPFFRCAERMGLGKQTAFGFGQIEVQAKDK
ncbi:CRISPR system precrRNA processing endoribonuclease RAMP protein Cas6 [Desulforhopalus vacuolatus]|nr:CRISPR system precrRNA processing endoribonuclease RAMP protein Cas6 [Desulforhopalus vacuolatus]